jgi:hypothetical protein
MGFMVRCEHVCGQVIDCGDRWTAFDGQRPGGPCSVVVEFMAITCQRREHLSEDRVTRMTRLSGDRVTRITRLSEDRVTRMTRLQANNRRKAEYHLECKIRNLKTNNRTSKGPNEPTILAPHTH